MKTSPNVGGLSRNERALVILCKQVADPRLARLSVKDEDEGIAKAKIISRRQAREDSDEESGESAQESSGESEEEDEEVTARRQAVRERHVFL